MALKIRIGSGISKLTIEPESDESVRVGQIRLETRIFWNKLILYLKREINYKKNC